jgi:hypothetical protein
MSMGVCSEPADACASTHGSYTSADTVKTARSAKLKK